MRRALALGLVLAGCAAKAKTVVPTPAPPPPPIAAAPLVVDAGASVVAAAAPASEQPLEWGTRPPREGPLYPVIDGMCIHGEIWALENGALYTYGNPASGYSRGTEPTIARFTDDGIDATDLKKRVDGKGMGSFAPFEIEGKWPGPLYAFSEDGGGSRTGNGSETLLTHDENGWKVAATTGGENGPNYQRPVFFQSHLVFADIKHSFDEKTHDSINLLAYHAVPPLEGIATLNHGGDYERNPLWATEDAIYVLESPKMSAKPFLRRWKAGKATRLGELDFGSRIVAVKPHVVIASQRRITELVDGKLTSFDVPIPPSKDDIYGIGHVSVAPNGDLWITETSQHYVYIARTGTRAIETMKIPAPALPRKPDEKGHSAANGSVMAGVEHDDPWVIGQVGALFHFEGGEWKEVALPQPPWATNRYRAETIQMRRPGDLYVNASYGTQPLGWKHAERYRAVLRTKRPREVLRCNEPPYQDGWSAGRDFMSFPPFATDECTAPFVVILKTAYEIDTPKPIVQYKADAKFPGVREAFKATPTAGEPDFVEFTSGTSRFLGAAVPTVAAGKELIAALAKSVVVLGEFRPELVCGKPPNAVKHP
jgi:hypothetical protein